MSKSNSKRLSHYKKLEPELAEKLGADAPKLVSILYRHIAERRTYGEYRIIEETGKKQILPTNTTVDLNQDLKDLHKTSPKYAKLLSARQLTKGKIARHLLSDDKEDWCWYFGSCQKWNGLRYGLVMLDFDCHHGQAQADCMATVELVINILPPDTRVYVETSTSGKGAHLFVLLSWHESVSLHAIYFDIRLLEKRLSRSTSHLPVSCSEVKGKPLLYGGIDTDTLLAATKATPADRLSWGVIKFGSFAKLPKPRSAGDAEELLDALSHHIPCSDFLASLDSFLMGAGGAGYKVLGSRSSSGPQTQPEAIPERQSSASMGAGGEGYKVLGSWGEKETQDTFARTKQFILSHRPQNPKSTLDDAYQAYQSQALEIGNSDRECFEKNWLYSERTWNQGGGERKSARSFLPKSKHLIEQILKSDTIQSLDDEFISRKNEYVQSGASQATIEKIKPLTRESLSRVFSCILYILDGTQEGSVGKEQIIALAKEAYGIHLIGLDWRAIRQWLEAHGLIEMTKEYIHNQADKRFSKCRSFRLKAAQ